MSIHTKNYRDESKAKKKKRKRKAKRKKKKWKKRERQEHEKVKQQQQQQEKLQSKCTISCAMVLCVFLFCVYSCTVARKRGKNNAVKSVLERRANQRGKKKHTSKPIEDITSYRAMQNTRRGMSLHTTTHAHTHTKKKKEATKMNLADLKG